MTIPWLPFFFMGLWKAVKKATPYSKTEGSGSGSVGPGESQAVLFSLAWLLVPLIFFTFSGSKLPGYILPSLPPALIISALSGWKFIGNSRRRAAGVVGMAAITLAVVVVLLVTVVPRYADDDSVKRLIAEADVKGYGGLEVLSQHAL
jgi:4-amino-4-deoxy-L-arabinose transferase-like glycosyltransferase